MPDRLPIEDIRELIQYSPGNGELKWKARGPRWFDDDTEACDRWNAWHAGNPCLTSNHRGAKRGILFGRWYAAKHVAWALVHGEWVEGLERVFHANGDTMDDRLRNLRKGLKDRRRSITHEGLPSCIEPKSDPLRYRARYYVNGKKFVTSFHSNVEAAMSEKSFRQGLQEELLTVGAAASFNAGIRKYRFWRTNGTLSAARYETAAQAVTAAKELGHGI